MDAGNLGIGGGVRPGTTAPEAEVAPPEAEGSGGIFRCNRALSAMGLG